MFINKNVYFMLTLNLRGLAQMQLWRLVTFVFVPSLETNPFYFLLELYFYWWIGNSLTRAWGDFRFTVYWLAGMVGAWLSCLISGYGSASGILLSMFFAYAWMWPNQQVLLFFFIPLKMKWMGWAALAVWVLEFLLGDFSTKLCMLFGLAGFLLFFGQELYVWCRNSVRDYKRRRDWKNNFR
ncbi:MAG: rhomboid family intramembrane serine protease, partial [Gemmiger sp.]